MKTLTELNKAHLLRSLDNIIRLIIIVCFLVFGIAELLYLLILSVPIMEAVIIFEKRELEKKIKSNINKINKEFSDKHITELEK